MNLSQPILASGNAPRRRHPAAHACARRVRMSLGCRQLLSSSTLQHWWAVDNEVLDQPKLEGLPLGVMDALELGVANNPRSVDFHANVSEYLSTIIASHQQIKNQWLMMQMTETHPEVCLHARLSLTGACPMPSHGCLADVACVAASQGSECDQARDMGRG